MPVISRFYGILVKMYLNDHGIPHVHAVYAEHEIVFGIDPPVAISGSAPARVRALMQEWISLHQEELKENWNLCRSHKLPNAVAPLD